MCTIRSNHNPSQLKNIIPPDSFLCPFYRSSLILHRSLLVTYRSSLHAISPDLQTNFAEFALQFRPFCSAISPILLCNFAHFVFLTNNLQFPFNLFMSFFPPSFVSLCQNLFCLSVPNIYVFLSPLPFRLSV